MRLTFKALAGALALPLAACATANAPSRDEVDGLRGEVAQLRARQAEQDREITALKSRLEDRPDRGAAAAPVATATSVRAEGATTVAGPSASGPRVPENLKVVYVAPDPIVLDDGPAPRAAAPAPSRKKPAGAPTPLPTDTELREPVSAEAGLSPEALEVAYKAALAAPDGPTALERFAGDHPQAPQADNALFEAGLRAERTGHADRAAKDFQRVVAEHPAGDAVADALLHLAACQLQLHQTDAARQTLAHLTHQFPGSAQAEAAQARLADLGG